MAGSYRERSDQELFNQESKLTDRLERRAVNGARRPCLCVSFICSWSGCSAGRCSWREVTWPGPETFGAAAHSRAAPPAQPTPETGRTMPCSPLLRGRCPSTCGCTSSESCPAGGLAPTSAPDEMDLPEPAGLPPVPDEIRAGGTDGAAEPALEKLRTADLRTAVRRLLGAEAGGGHRERPVHRGTGCRDPQRGRMYAP